jgi:hypothetical protein
MKIWTPNKFEGHWPVGTAAVVVAPSRDSAKTYLDHFLAESNLEPCDAVDFEELPLQDGEVAILCDGNY